MAPKDGSPETRGRRSVDWTPIRTAYMCDPNQTLEALAKRFGCGVKSIRNKSSAEKWVDQRNDFIAKSDAAIEKKLIEQRVLSVDDFNLEDVKMAKAMKAYAAREMSRLQGINKLDGTKLKELAIAYEKAQAIGRKALGLATSSTELYGKGGAPLNATPPIINVNFVKPDAASGD